MNHTIAPINDNVYNPAASRASEGEQETLLGRIVDRLGKIAQTFGRKDERPVETQSTYMEANLLDPTMGPEISRTLRR